MNSGQKLERKIKHILKNTVGKKFSWKSKQFVLLDWGKPVGQITGEVKTDFLLVLEELKSKKIEMIKISGKQNNMSAIHNKLTAVWCQSIYHKEWKEHLAKQTRSIVEKDGFSADKIIDFAGKKIALGFRHEIMDEPRTANPPRPGAGRKRGTKTKPEIYPEVFWGEGCPEEYRHGKMKSLRAKTKQRLKDLNLCHGNNVNFIKDSGIPDFVIKADADDINTIADILNNLSDIKKFAEEHKDDLIDAYFAQNYLLDRKVECANCGTLHRERYENVTKNGKIISLKKNSRGVQRGKCPKCGSSKQTKSSREFIQGTDRSMLVAVKFRIINKKLDAVPILSEHHQVNCEKVFVELRNCLLQLGVPDDSNFDVKMLVGKVTERAYNNLRKQDLLRLL